MSVAESKPEKPKEQTSQSQSTQSEPPHTESMDAELIDISEFMRFKFRVATIVEAEAVPKSKKLVRLQFDLGDEEGGKRQILAGIAAHYQPEDLVGRQIVVVANLKPAKLMGHESRGMLLAAGDGAEVLSLLAPDTKVANGSQVR